MTDYYDKALSPQYILSGKGDSYASDGGFVPAYLMDCPAYEGISQTYTNKL